MQADDTDYYYQRAEVELKRAAESSCPPAVKAHYELAEHYLERAYPEDVSNKPAEDAE